jgi:signal peptidase I
MSETGEKANGAVFCRGESMRPLFRPGDRIHFAPCRIEKLRRGDVIIFAPPGQEERVVHRVVSTGPAVIRTKEDANPYRDAGEAAASAGIYGECVMKGACVGSCIEQNYCRSANLWGGIAIAKSQ